MKDNKLIAEFMGGILSSVPNLINLPQTVGEANLLCVKGSERLLNGTYSVHRLNELKYHTSWDWLMPVVKKINQVCGYDDYNKSRLHLQRVLNDCINENAVGIDEVHKAVVEFITNKHK